MKKLLIFVFIAFSIAQVACKKNAIASGVPKCISNNIQENQKKQDWYYSKVEEYRFQGKLVYAFQPDNRIIADASTTIYNNNCTRLCDIGGFGGPSVNLCNGENFFQNAVLIRVIWEKP